MMQTSRVGRSAVAWALAVACAGCGLGLGLVGTSAGAGVAFAGEAGAVAASAAADGEVGGAGSDAASSASDAGTSSGASAGAGEIAVAAGLEGADAEAVAQGKTVKCIDQYFTNLADAVELANQNGGGTIAILADTVATDDASKTATIGFRTSIMIKSEGDEPLRIYRAEGQTGPMLAITDGTINLKNVTFDASGEQATAPVIAISDQAVVKFGKGLTITGNTTDGSGVAEAVAASAASVSGKSAKLTLKEGCVISGCVGTGAVQAAIVNDGATVDNEGATFENNTVEQGDNPNYAGTGKLKGDEI